MVIESEGESPPSRPGRRRSLGGSEPHHVTLIVFGVGMVNRTHLEADIGGLTMEAELKKIHGSFTLKEKMKGIQCTNTQTHTHYAFIYVETHPHTHTLYTQYTHLLMIFCTQTLRPICINYYLE